jgi:hypothetical protein
MTKSELKQLIRETIEEIDGNQNARSKKALDTINFLGEVESMIAETSEDVQCVRQTKHMLVSLLTDSDYKILYPGTNIGKVGGGDREDFAKGT